MYDRPDRIAKQEFRRIATTLTRTLAERPGYVALVDIANNFAAPRATITVDFVVKVVVTPATLRSH